MVTCFYFLCLPYWEHSVILCCHLGKIVEMGLCECGEHQKTKLLVSMFSILPEDSDENM
jgi:hypothetical protein